MSGRRWNWAAGFGLFGLLACLFPLAWAEGGKERGEEVFKKLCLQCHTVADARARARKHGRREALMRHLRRMVGRASLEGLRNDAYDDLIAYLLPAPDEKKLTPALAEGKDVFIAKCGRCHRHDVVKKAHKRMQTESGWQSLVRQERLRSGSRITEKEGEAVARYLAWAYPPPTKAQERTALERTIQRKCAACHDFDLADLQARLPRDWDVTVEVMRRLDPFLIGVDEARRFSAYFKKNHRLTPPGGKEKDREEARVLFREKCFRCHSLTLATSPGEYFKNWAHEVERMRQKSPRFFTREQGRRIAAFLERP